MSVSIDFSPFADDPKSAVPSEAVPDDLFEAGAISSVEDYQLRATRRAQLEDADTLRRMRAL